MTEEHILSFKPAAGLDQIGNECCERVQDRKHRSQRCDDSALSCESRPDRIFGRDTNLWTYPGASSLGSDAREGLKHHPTVKPVAMLEDALLDMTERGDIVLDPFLGSGSTLIACEKTGRRCRGLELDPAYVEVILRRYEAVTKRPAILESTGETYAELAIRRQREAEYCAHPRDPDPTSAPA